MLCMSILALSTCSQGLQQSCTTSVLWTLFQFNTVKVPRGTLTELQHTPSPSQPIHDMQHDGWPLLMATSRCSTMLQVSHPNSLVQPRSFARFYQDYVVAKAGLDTGS